MDLSVEKIDFNISDCHTPCIKGYYFNSYGDYFTVYCVINIIKILKKNQKIIDN